MTSPTSSHLLAQLSGLSGGTPVPGKTANIEKARQESQEFESVFLSKVLNEMFSTLEEGSGPLGAQGAGGDTWRSFLVDEYAKEISKGGGIGVADQVMRELISVQEQSQ